MEPNTIKINEVEYVRKDSATPVTTKDYVLVRTRDAGVFAGYLHEKNGLEIVLHRARRIYYWDGAATLSQLAMEGTKKPEKCKFPCPVTSVTLQWIEIIPCTEIAKKSIEGVKVWSV